MGGVQSFLVDPRWLGKALSVADCSMDDRVFMVGGDNGQVAGMLAGQCHILLAEPDAGLAGYLYSLGLHRTQVINAEPHVVLRDEPFDKLLCLQPGKMSEEMLNGMLRVPFSSAVVMAPDTVLASTRRRNRLGTLLRACFDVEVLQSVPRTAFSPRLEEPCSLAVFSPKERPDAVASALQLLVRESGTMRGLLTRSCREFFGYTLAEAQGAVRLFDAEMLRKRFWNLSEGEFSEVVGWLRQG